MGKRGVKPASLKEFIRRFESYYIKTKTCWVWQKAKHSYGYGVTYYQGKTFAAHKISMLIYRNKPLSSSNKQFHWDHLCRNPACINPDHLELVPAGENLKRGIGMSSRIVKHPKKHYPSGERHGQSKLKLAQVKELISLSKQGYTYVELSRIFKVSETTASRIARGLSWRRCKAFLGGKDA